MRTDADRAALEYWNGFSGAWQHVPAPLAPAEDDVRWFELQLRSTQRAGGSEARALLLGVTPAIANLRWPADCVLVAMDWSRGMLRNVWVQPRSLAWAKVVAADWRRTPLAAGSCDVVVGDGCYTALGSLENAAGLNREMRRVLRDGGHYFLRCFVRPEAGERLDDLFGELVEGRVPNLDLYRWRLAMAIQGDSPHGVSLDAAWKVWNERVGDAVPALARRHGWPESALRNIDRWKGVRMRYFFPSVDELSGLAEPYFEIVGCDFPGYEWGARFPRVAMRAR